MATGGRRFDTRMTSQALAGYQCDTLGVVDEDDVSDGIDSQEETSVNDQ